MKLLKSILSLILLLSLVSCKETSDRKPNATGTSYATLIAYSIHGKHKRSGGDGFTYLHIFLKPDGSFSGELQEFLYEDDGSQYDVITKEPVEESESLQEYLNRI